MSSYFLLTEIGQLYHKRILYFSTIWNVPDLIVPILVIVVVSYHLQDL